jgi:hypothetical protein
MILPVTIVTEATCLSQDRAGATPILTSHLHTTHASRGEGNCSRMVATRAGVIRWNFTVSRKQRLMELVISLRLLPKYHDRACCRLLAYIYLDQMSRFLCRETEFIMHIRWIKSYSVAVFLLRTATFIKLEFVERKIFIINLKICLRICWSEVIYLNKTW